MYILKVKGQYFTRDGSPEATMADMLRYDDGEMIDFTSEPIEGLRGYERFTAEVHTNNFTPARWSSFGLRTEMLRKEPGKAPCSFPDTKSVTDFIDKADLT